MLQVGGRVGYNTVTVVPAIADETTSKDKNKSENNRGPEVLYTTRLGTQYTKSYGEKCEWEVDP